MAALPPNPRPHYLRFLSGNLDDNSASRLLGCIEGARDRGAVEIHLALSILGGTTQTAVAVYNSLIHSATPIITYNIGMCASAGVTAFLGGHQRFCSSFATFMVHPHSSNHSGPISMGFAADLVAMNAASENQVEAILRERAELTEEMLRDRRLRDVHINAQAAVDRGIVDGIREFVAPAGTTILQVL